MATRKHVETVCAVEIHAERYTVYLRLLDKRILGHYNSSLIISYVHLPSALILTEYR
jgi:hypothetical protein